MRIDRAIAIVRSIGKPSRRNNRRAIPAPTYRAPPPQRRWTWEGGSPMERADVVRAHYKNRDLTGEDLCRTFNLTCNGLIEIIRGKNWSPEYQRS